MIDQELKKRWIDALRSGKYIQGDSTLRFFDADSGKDTFCCLGVLCDLIEPNNWTHSNGDWCWAQKVEVPPDHYIGILGLNIPFRIYTVMNDKEHKSFYEIADYIEANE